MVTAIDVKNGTQLKPVQHWCKAMLGERVSPPTLWRWVNKGVKGVKLDAVQVAGKWRCTAEAFAEFINGQTDAALNPHSDNVADDDSLKAAGLL